MKKPKVPAGLKRCRKCRYYKGTCIQNGEKEIVSCCCNPHICQRCGTPVFKCRIGSNYYNEENGLSWHVSVYTAWAHKCPDGIYGQMSGSPYIDPNTGSDILK